MSAHNSLPGTRPAAALLRRKLRVCCAWWLLLGGSVVGCAVGPNYHAPAAPAVTRYTVQGDPTATVPAQGTAQHFSPGGALASDWWHLFGSASLDRLVGQALAANPGLQAAQASLRASQDDLRAGYGVFYPQIGVSAAAARQRTAPISAGLAASPSVFNLFTLSASVYYALDLFGGHRRLVEGLAAQVDLQRATAQATSLMLESNVVNDVIAAAAYREELAATHEFIDLQREQVRLGAIRAQA